MIDELPPDTPNNCSHGTQHDELQWVCLCQHGRRVDGLLQQESEGRETSPKRPKDAGEPHGWVKLLRRSVCTRPTLSRPERLVNTIGTRGRT